MFISFSQTKQTRNNCHWSWCFVTIRAEPWSGAGRQRRIFDFTDSAGLRYCASWRYLSLPPVWNYLFYCGDLKAKVPWREFLVTGYWHSVCVVAAVSTRAFSLLGVCYLCRFSPPTLSWGQEMVSTSLALMALMKTVWQLPRLIRGKVAMLWCRVHEV